MLDTAEHYDPHHPPKDIVDAVDWIRDRLTREEAGARQFLKQFAQGESHTPHTYTEALKFLEHAARYGHANAQVNIGLRYAYGRGVPQNDAKALHWFRAVTEDLEPNGSTSGNDATGNISETLDWCLIKARNGHREFQLICGLILSRVAGFSARRQEAFDWIRRAADQEVPEAQFQLGKIYAAGEGVSKSNTEAFKWFMRAAEHGEHPDAMYAVGEMYRLAEGTARNLHEAHKWYLEANEYSFEGHTEARYRLGVMYRDGHGVARDHGAAREWFEAAAFRASYDAIGDLGLMCAAGEGGPQDFTEAMSWIMPAAAAGHVRAQRYLDTLKELNLPDSEVPEDHTEAFHWYVRAAEKAYGGASAQGKHSLRFPDTGSEGDGES
jgi:TPR repeat protein